MCTVLLHRCCIIAYCSDRFSFALLGVVTVASLTSKLCCMAVKPSDTVSEAINKSYPKVCKYGEYMDQHNICACMRACVHVCVHVRVCVCETT